MSKGETVILAWGALFVASVVVAERMERGCKSCGATLSVLQALRSATCPSCERTLGFFRNL